MLDWLRRLRAWLFVRLGLWRHQWRRGQVDVAGVRFFGGAFQLRAWRYGLYVPAGIRDDTPAPLVILLHGCKQRALNFAYATGWTAFADRAGVRLLCPDQRRIANLFRCWNWFHPLAQGGRGELDVVLAMLDRVAQSVRVDRTAAVGLSAGGAMAALLAFHHPDRIDAAITVAAPPLMGLAMQTPQAVMQRGLSANPLNALGGRQTACAPLAVIHGTADDVVTPRCAEQLLAQAVEAQRRGGVVTSPVEVSAPEAGLAVVDYRSAAGTVLRSVFVRDMGHVWTGGPGGHPFCEKGGPSVTALCVQFLRDAAFFGAKSP